MRLLLAAMPWQAVQRPSLPVGLLHALVRRECPHVEVSEYHGAIRLTEYMLRQGGPGPADYVYVADSVLNGFGDWIFAGCLYGDTGWRVAEIQTYAERHGLNVSTILRMRELAADFIEEAAAEILSGAPDVVGFTSTFMQNVPSLALARRLKELCPAIRIVLGGANCDGPMGHALHRNHPFIDFVVRGEGEEAFPQLLRAVESAAPPRDIPGLCWWDGDRSVANVQPTRSVPPDIIPMPDFDAWHNALESSSVRAYVVPELAIEGSRGCWWGEKHHCTFCGLNGSLMKFRAKSAERFWEELSTLVERYQILDFSAVDNIIDMAYFDKLLPKLADADWDLRIHYEIKSNVRPSQVKALADAGIVMVQPGIESLSGRVLKLMDKGVDGATNVRVLRDCEDNHMTVSWNYLYGFPGERPDDYWSVLTQLPALVHLQPPSGAVRIILERFSPYFEQPEKGFAQRTPAAFYRHVYDLSDSELFDLAYFFDGRAEGISGDVLEALRSELYRWRRDYPYSYLVATDEGASITIDDRRRGWAEQQHHLHGWRAAAYRALARPRSPKSLRTALVELGHSLEDADVESWLDESMKSGLIFTDSGRFVALATTVATQRISPPAPEHEAAMA